MSASAATRWSGPAQYVRTAGPGGPSALARLDRDVIALSGVRTVVWLEGINDFSRNGNATMEAVTQGFRDGVARLRAAIPGVRVVGATVLTAFGSTNAAHGHDEQDAKRRGLNDFIRNGGLFDAVLDFDAGDARPGDRHAAAGDGAGLHHRRPRRRAAPQPRRLSGDGHLHRSGRRSAPTVTRLSAQPSPPPSSAKAEDPRLASVGRGERRGWSAFADHGDERTIGQIDIYIASGRGQRYAHASHSCPYGRPPTTRFGGPGGRTR